MQEIILIVEGMSCNHCVNAVKTAVFELNGVTKVEVDLETKEVIVNFDSKVVGIEIIKGAIIDEGYEVL